LASSVGELGRVAARIRRHGAGAQQGGGHGGRRPAATAAGVRGRGEQGVAGTADSAAEPDATAADGHASGQGQRAVLLARRFLRRRHRRHGRRVRAKTLIDFNTRDALQNIFLLFFSFRL